MALLHVLSLLAPDLGIGLHAHGVDHGLRPEAKEELDTVEQLARRLEVRFSRTCLQIRSGGNLQARAREGRYGALDRAAKNLGARWVATAHHADDRAETVLCRLLRGTGPKGLGVLPTCSEGRLRPFIRSRRSAIALHLKRHDIPYRSDPSNQDPRFLRVRIRQELMPLLEDLSSGAANRLNRLADDLMSAELDDGIEVTHPSGDPIHLSRVHIAQIRRARKLKQQEAEIWLPGGVRVQVDPISGAVSVKPPQRSDDNSAKPSPGRQNGSCGGVKAGKSD